MLVDLQITLKTKLINIVKNPNDIYLIFISHIYLNWIKQMNSYEEPLELMKKKIGEQIYVRLRNQTSIQGKLVAYDEHLNMMIQNLKINKGTDVQ